MYSVLRTDVLVVCRPPTLCMRLGVCIRIKGSTARRVKARLGTPHAFGSRKSIKPLVTFLFLCCATRFDSTQFDSILEYNHIKEGQQGRIPHFRPPLRRQRRICIRDSTEHHELLLIILRSLLTICHNISRQPPWLLAMPAFSCPTGRLLPGQPPPGDIPSPARLPVHGLELPLPKP